MKTQGKITSTLVGISLAATNIACRISKVPLIGDLETNYRTNSTETSLSWYRIDPKGQPSNETFALLKYPDQFYVTRSGSNSRGGYGQEIASTRNGVSIISSDENGVWFSGRYRNGAWEISELDLNHFRRR